ncbi:predicted protein [Nematostella vectensis]|uniref:Uncharacterized protein n=1 Tax=Nematostella vectensis TaxID=45351 RepID=A7RX67_NEMVE|nr:ectonucleoside triphosphate diphosphohydrolase 1 [Nematostella vectensis]EDO43911.1 predicted protein [Nematostella vectensis]|eukprot:XP_001635974.1 predicted protein [Nematostella vectensis]
MKFSTTWLLLVFLGTCLALVSARTIPKAKYAVLFDAGSSGTRCKVYKLIQRQTLHVRDVTQLNVPKPNKAKPGLSSFGESPAGVGPYLQTLIEGAKKVVPVQYQAQTPVYLFATAGMRLLPVDQKIAVINEVNNFLRDSKKSPFAFKKGNAKVISGIDEATYDWVTVNFLMGALTGESDTEYGVLDMGGASTQNAFDTNNTQHITVVLDLTKGMLPLYAHSYLGYGEQEARKRFIRFLVNNRRHNRKVITNPCYNSNFEKRVEVDGAEYLMRGGFNPQMCHMIIKSLFFCLSSKKDNCPFHQQPRLKGKFYSFSLFTYAFRETGVVSKNGERIDMETLKRKMLSFCGRDLTEKELANKYTTPRCFQLNFIYSMLTDGYRVDNSFELYNGESINGLDLNWTLGAMLSALKVL